MAYCRDCRFWDGWDDIHDPAVIGTCTRIMPRPLTPDDQEPPDPDPNDAGVTHGGSVSTGRDFGCTLFEAKG